jgi:hypothetical protein
MVIRKEKIYKIDEEHPYGIFKDDRDLQKFLDKEENHYHIFEGAKHRAL